MTKTQPIQPLDLTIGPAAVFCLAADLRQPPVPAGQVHPFARFGNHYPQPVPAPRVATRLHAVATSGERSHRAS